MQLTLSEIPSETECQTVGPDLRPQTVCKGYQQTTLEDKELCQSKKALFDKMKIQIRLQNWLLNITHDVPLVRSPVPPSCQMRL